MSESAGSPSTPAAETPPLGSIRERWFWWLLPLAALFLAYLPTLGAGVVTDDGPLVVENPYLASPAGIVHLIGSDLWDASNLHQPTEYYRPLPMVSFWLQFRLSQAVPWLRLGNLVLFLCTAWVLTRVLTRHGARLPVASFVVLLWGLHPLNTESVIWLSARFELFVLLFVLLALGANAGERARIWKVPLFMALALLSKEVGIVALPLLLLHDLGRRQSMRREWPKHVVLVAVVGLYFVARWTVGVASAAAAVSTRAPLEFFTSYATLLVLYARLAVWPFGFDVHHWYQPLDPLGVAVVAGALLVLLFWGLRRARSGQLRPATLLGISLALGSLVPPALIGPNVHFVGDRFSYLSWAGVCLACGSAWKRPERRALLRTSLAVGIFVALCWLALTIHRGQEWGSAERLMAVALAREPEHPHWTVLRAHALLEQGRPAEALETVSPIAATHPDYPQAQNALCVAALRTQRGSRADAACRRAVDIAPTSSLAWANLAALLVHRADWRGALGAAQKALAYRTPYAEAEYLVAVSSANLGQFDQARVALERGLRAEPEHRGLLLLREQMQQRGLLQNPASGHVGAPSEP